VSLLRGKAEAAVGRDEATDLQHDLVAVAQAQPPWIAETADAVHPDRDRPAERGQSARSERLTPDREQIAELRRPLETNDSARIERPQTCPAAGGDHSAEPQSRRGDSDRRRHDHDAPAREQLDVHAPANPECGRPAGEPSLPCGWPVGRSLPDRRRHEPADRKSERRCCAASDDRHRRHRRRSLRVLAAVAAALAAGAAAPAAQADGDPASDYLIGQKIFLPYDAKLPARPVQMLNATVHSANTQGFPVRVALIWSNYDLGSVTVLWNKPRTYARFLGIELSYYFKGRLIVVMPNGIGLYWHGHPTGPGYKVLDPITVKPTPAGLAEAATAAVQRLAAASGVTVSTSAKGAAAPKPPPSTTTHDRIVIVVAVLVALAFGGLFRLLIRHRAAARRPR
jgi:hypothetical protein